MNEIYQKNKLFFIILFTAVVGFLVWYFRNIVIFIIVAGVVSIVGSPLVELLDRMKYKWIRLPHSFNVIVTLLLILLLFFGMFSLFIPLVINEAQLFSSIDGQ